MLKATSCSTLLMLGLFASTVAAQLVQQPREVIPLSEVPAETNDVTEMKRAVETQIADLSQRMFEMNDWMYHNPEVGHEEVGSGHAVPVRQPDVVVHRQVAHVGDDAVLDALDLLLARELAPVFAVGLLGSVPGHHMSPIFGLGSVRALLPLIFRALVGALIGAVFQARVDGVSEFAEALEQRLHARAQRRGQ